MINLYEYQAKKLFVQYDLPVLKGWVCSNINDVQNCITHNKGPWVAKCQIYSGSRGKSEGICITCSINKILSFSKKWFGNKLITCQTTDTGELVNYILIEPAVKIIQELYVSIVIDRDSYQILCITSAQGGINVENISQESPEAIHKIIIDPVFGIYPYQGRILACKLGLSGNKINQFSDIIVNMTRMFLEKDLMLAEINPLVITTENSFFCLDAKMIVDQNSIFRQSKLLDMCIKHDTKTIAIKSNKKQLNINYIPLPTGNIGCMVNGAGLAMATMDLIQDAGGMPANFLDIGGEANKECIISALHMLLKNKKIKAILVNIFGGIVCCDLVANSIISVLSNIPITNNDIHYIPIVVRLQGNNAELGSKKLIDSKFNIIVTNNLINAIQQAVIMVK